MSTDSKILVGVLAAVTSAMAAVAGWSHDVPFWPAALLVFPVTLVGLAVRRGEPELGTASPELAVSAGGYTAVYQNPVVDVPLPSARPGYDFRFAATVRWREPISRTAAAHANPGALAVNLVVTRAVNLLATQLPENRAVAERTLESALGISVLDPSSQVDVWATGVALTLPDADVERLRRHAELRKDEALWESERDYERNKRAYLGDDVLKSTGSAVVWALARKEDSIERAVELIGPLALLSAAANDAELPAQFRDLVAAELRGRDGYRSSEADGFEFRPGDLIRDTEAPEQDPHWPDPVVGHVAGIMDEIGFGPETTERMLFADLIVQVFKTAGQHDAANAVKLAFEKVIPGEEPWTDEPGGGEDSPF